MPLLDFSVRVAVALFCINVENALVVACSVGSAGRSGAGTGEFNNGNNCIAIVAGGAGCAIIVTDDCTGGPVTATDSGADGAKLVKLAGAGGACDVAAGCIATGGGSGSSAVASCFQPGVVCNISIWSPS